MMCQDDLVVGVSRQGPDLYLQLLEHSHTRIHLCVWQRKSQLSAPLLKKSRICIALGLERRKLQFLQSDCEVHKKIVGAYPRLNDCGGYELLQARGTFKFLGVIPQPPERYSAMYFKSMGQMRIYRRPKSKEIWIYLLNLPLLRYVGYIILQRYIAMVY